MNNQSSNHEQRQVHYTGKNLLPNEIQCLYEILGNSRLTLATAVAQILHGHDGQWVKQACGVLCFIKDYEQRLNCFRVYDLRSRKMIYEQIILPAVRLEKSLELFYTFDGTHCKIGINFVDRDEAQTFFHHFHTKQEDRQNKRNHRSSAKVQQTPIISAASPDVKSPIVSKSKGTDKKQSISKSSMFGTFGRSKPKNARPEISRPLPESWTHTSHVGPTNSFVADESQRELFEQVLSKMNLSPDEETYVRKNLNNTKRDTGNFRATQKPSATVARTRRTRGPHQDIAIPPITHSATNGNAAPVAPPVFDSHPPIAPPLPPVFGPHPPIAPPLPPVFGPHPPIAPPLPDLLSNPSKQSECPSPAVVVTGQSKKESTSDGEPKGWLKDIINHNSSTLKKVPERPPIPKEIVQKTDDPEPKLTMEEHILEMLRKRRKDIMGSDNEPKNSSESEWSD